MNLKEIERAAEIIRHGGLVAFPTETVYGLGANALDPVAVAKIFEAKARPSFDPLIVHIAVIEDLTRLISVIDERIYKLTDKFWPGPLTIVMPKKNIVPDIITSGLPNVAIRMPANNIALNLIKMSDCPIAAPSANKFGQLSPTKAEHVRKQLPFLPCILDGGSTSVGIESTVISLKEDGFLILRQGIITREDLEKVLPCSSHIDKNKGLSSPGLLKSHYSPIKPIYILGEYEIPLNKSNAGLISFTGADSEKYKSVEILSGKGDLKEAAANLFGALHRLEESDIDYIVAEKVPESGIGLAIMDKLRKASYRYSN
ncbi:MAG TPA: threonylcarbamoyl-AMP synthase [Lentisphaeria bacterium]|nr:MAG: threonylcarbamoyl-AMP synthase [Lentisphaerae bacterium GWF2_38_69]HBM16364.1 threonylcarbamoyl-AMP synthase [Lentisphaeria bacterium]